MKNYVSFACLLLVGFVGFGDISYAKNARDGLDDYHFDQKEYNKSSIQVNVVTFTSMTALQAAAKRFGLHLAERARAFTVTHGLEGKECTMYIMDPLTAYQPEQYGHELSHCFWGPKFHIDE